MKERDRKSFSSECSDVNVRNDGLGRVFSIEVYLSVRTFHHGFLFSLLFLPLSLSLTPRVSDPIIRENGEHTSLCCSLCCSLCAMLQERECDVHPLLAHQLERMCCVALHLRGNDIRFGST